MDLVTEVLGIPVPQGSKRVYNGRLVDVNDRKLRDWRALVGSMVASDKILAGPLTVRFNFYLPRPRGHYGTGRNADKLKPSAPIVPATKPDLDKLVRACLDAMTGMAFRDDSQVAQLSAAKWYADERKPGVSIEVKELS